MRRLTVLGIGNILMRDEGIGPHLLQALSSALDWGDDVEFIDGGAGGLSLLNIIEEANSLIVIDAAQMNLPPGEHRLLTPEQIEAEDSHQKLSLHEMPFIQTLRLCEQYSRRPTDIVIFAIQPAEIGYGRELSAALREKFPQLLEAAVELVRQRLA